VLLMLLADARLPTGAHTQSAGLEPAMRQGVSLDQVPGYIRTRLCTVVAVEAGAAVVARHLAVAETDGVADGLRAVDDAWRARTISPALRENAEVLGRGYARLVAGLWPDAPASVALRAVRRPTRAVAIGVAAALTGLTGRQVARLIGYDDAQTVAAAALKLDPLDPLVATRWVVQAAPDIDRMAATVCALTTPDEIPAGAAPLIEQWAQVHAVTSQRLFRA
jgi:urease accessory protein